MSEGHDIPDEAPEPAEDLYAGLELVAGDPLPDADEDEADRVITPFIDPPLSECPVLPLGFEAGKVVFAMPEGEIRHEAASKIGQMIKADIFVCAKGQAFLGYWRNKAGEFMRERATIWFVRKCRERGRWDAGRPMRGLGVWPGPDDEVLLHLGDEIYRFPAPKHGKAGKFQARTVREMLGEGRGPLYRLLPPAPRPAKAAAAADGAWVRARLDAWAFEPIGEEGLTGADVVCGWLMAALLGAAAPFRGHLMVHALAGSGKTELMAFVQALLSALAGEVIDSFTPAGLKTDLAGHARPVLIDEAEAASGPAAPAMIEQALELLRRMSTGSGGQHKQGGLAGASVTLTAVGAAMVAGITPPKLAAADASRFVEVRLLPLPRERATRTQLEAAKARARSLAPHLLGRAIKGARRYLADVEAITAALSAEGETPRAADLVAMLAAGRRLLLFDEPLDEDGARGEVRLWRPLLSEREAGEGVRNPGADALAHLMAADSGVHVRDRRESVGGLVRRSVGDERGAYDQPLADMGLKLDYGPGPDGREGPWLVVSNQHPRLEAIFKGTAWTAWRRSLALSDALGPEFKTWATTSSLRFGVGVKQRALCIPLAPWMDKRSAAVPRTVPPYGADYDDEF